MNHPIPFRTRLVKLFTATCTAFLWRLGAKLPGDNCVIVEEGNMDLNSLLSGQDHIKQSQSRF